MNKSNCEVQILVNGKPIKQYIHEGNAWVEARKGINYEIKIKNNNWQRVLAVVSVDGLDVLSGSPADENSGGYIIDAYGTYTIKGFRTSNDSVNLFEFSDKEQSYAVQSPTGEQSSRNAGGIGVTIIAEKKKPILIKRRNDFDDIYRIRPRHVPYDPYPVPQWPTTRPSYPNYPEVICKGGGDNMTLLRAFNHAQERSLAPEESYTQCLTDSNPVDLDMGTKFSDVSIEDKVTTVQFERGDVLEQIAIYYASKKVLQKLGISFVPEPKVVLPQLFKGNFCQPPKRS